MAEFRKLIVTSTGNTLLAKAIAGSTKIIFTKAALGASNYADADIPALTSLGDILQEAPILETSNESSSIVHVAVTLDNATVAEGFTYASVGLFAADDAGLEILFAVAGSNAPGSVPPSSSSFSVNLDLSLGVSSTEVIELTPRGEGTINDIAVNTTNTWSSKNTVDRLCEAFTVTGDVVQCYPVGGYPLTVEARGKNLIPYPYLSTTRTENGITFTDSGDGSITVNGTATGDALFFITTSFTSQAIGEAYCLSGCPAGGGDKKYGLDCYGGGGSYSRDTGSGVTVTPKDTSKMTFRIIIYSGATVNNLVFKPQLELGSVATAYEPYRESVAVWHGGKNLVKYPYFRENGYTFAGVTWTVNGDGSVSANGTATAHSIFLCRRHDFTLPPGTYTISGAPGGSQKSYNMQLQYTNAETGVIVNTLNVNGPQTFTLDVECTVLLQCVIYNGYTAQNTSFKPQLEFGVTATEFEPYRGDTTTFSTAAPAIIPALGGVNTMYADSGKVTVTGREDPRHTVGSLEERIAALEAAIVNNG